MERNLSNLNPEDMEIFVTEPNLVKEGVSSNTNYTVKEKNSLSL